LKRLSEAIYRFKEWEEGHLAGKTHPSGFAFGTDATEAVRGGGQLIYNGKNS
jgi:hypothetical protein